MSTWKQYQLGNGLRGMYQYKARSIKEAWDIGCRRFNRGFPTKSPSGRSVTMEVWDNTTLPMLKTKWNHDQDKLPPKKRFYMNHTTTTYRGYVPIAEGMSKQKLVFRK